ncbi:hypothetical protein TRICI_002524 [Trichomonascus ciferrii]|uniref:ABC transporter domain-containing protein n=1 Tax=Trichomonascus ciferrii TaxID=44093 RepID=A0A642V5Q7_9ASCO|nr:hypothetical protein TRICI_002524 [Trichomonascus ciferrii]
MAARGTMYCWDNATRGLDSSTALEYARAIRASTNILRNVSIMAAYQASENIYNLFDKVTVLYSGKQIFFGHVSRAKEYFERMGFYCRPRQTTVEFLSAITDPNGRCMRNGYEEIAPQTVDEFVAYWRQSPEYMALVDEKSRYSYFANPEDTVTRFRNVRAREKMAGQRNRSRYLLNYPAQLWLAVTRGFQRINGDRAYTIARLFGCVVQGVIIGTLFYNMSEGTSGAFSRSGIMFYALLFNVLSPLSDIPIAFINRPVILKQRGYSFYHPSVEALQNLVTDLPIRIILVLTFTVIFYFLSGMNNSAPRFFIYFLFSLLPTFCISTLFQLISATVKTVSTANSVAGIVNSAFIIYAGYMIPTFSMHPWFRWINYINPLNYAFESMVTNEFHEREMHCNSVIPSGPGYEKVNRENQVCAFSGSLPGQDIVSGDHYLEAEYRYEHDHLWRNFGILLGFWALFIVLQTIFTEYLKPHMNKGNSLLFKRGFHPVDNGALPFANKRNSTTSVLTQRHMMDSFFSWQDVNYTIPVKTKKRDQEKTRTLLHDVQGYVVPGKLTALMGESGAGKTTLLNVLSQRANLGTVTGDIYVNGRPVDETFKRRTGYVQQQDVHLSETTVRESLQFAARLRQPADVPDEEKLAYVETIIDMLGMGSYADAFIGTVEKGLTGEQRKKLSIGVELVAKPSLLLFLDEPTSGLDSQSAWAIVKLLRSLADSGQAILCTIHQPSATLFEQFDRLLLLSKGGKTVYFGEIGPNSQTVVNYFEKNGARPCMDDENPAEYMLDCIGAGATATVSQDWAHVWENSKDFIAIKDEITNISIQTWQQPDRILKHELESKSLTGKYATGYFTQLKWMLWRTSIQYWRSPTYIYSKLVLMILVGLFAGFTYWKVDDSVVGLKNVLFSILLILLLSAPLSNQIQAHVFPSRELFEGRENASNTFHWSILPLSHFLVELPYHLLFSSILFCCFYFPTGYNTDAENAGMFYFVYCVLFQIYYISFSLLVVYISPDIPSAGALTSLLFTFKVAFCGILQPKSEIPGFWTFMYKVSPYTYFVQSILGSILHNKPVVCQPEEFNVFQPMDGMTCYEFAGTFISRAGGYLNNPEATDNCQYCQYRSGDEYLARSMDTEWSDRWRNVGFFFIYIVFNLLAMLALFYLFRVKVWKQNRSKPNNKKDNFLADADAIRAKSCENRKGSIPSSRRRSANEGKEWWIKPEPSGSQKLHIDVSPYPPKA